MNYTIQFKKLELAIAKKKCVCLIVEASFPMGHFSNIWSFKIAENYLYIMLTFLTENGR